MSGCNRPWLRTLGLTLLALLAVATLLNGLLHAWLAPGGDMFLRLNEYGYFRNGVFPHPQLALRKGLEITTVSVYPPYAMPMFAPFFHPGGAMLCLLCKNGPIYALHCRTWRSTELAERSIHPGEEVLFEPGDEFLRKDVFRGQRGRDLQGGAQGSCIQRASLHAIEIHNAQSHSLRDPCHNQSA